LVLRKAIYGLKQAGARWYARFKDELIKIGFIVAVADETVFVLIQEGQLVCALLVHVDDALIGGERDIQKLEQAFPLTKLGQPTYFLGVEIDFDRKTNSVRLSQRGYARTLLERANMTDCKTCITPASQVRLEKPDESVSEEERKYMENVPYREINGGIGYVVQWTRPDLGFAWSETSRFMSDPRREHWVALKRQLRYLKGTMEYGLEYKRDDGSEVRGYSDADHAGDQQTRKSKTGNVHVVGRFPVSWVARTQRSVTLSSFESVTLSSFESESVSLSEAVKQSLWWLKVLKDYLWKQHVIPLRVDNEGLMKGVNGRKNVSSRLKHLDVRYKFSREAVSDGKVTVTWIQGNEMPADIFTKPLGRILFLKFRVMIGVRPVKMKKKPDKDFLEEEEEKKED
jgi:hypothetical protein